MITVKVIFMDEDQKIAEVVEKFGNLQDGDILDIEIPLWTLTKVVEYINLPKAMRDYTS